MRYQTTTWQRALQQAKKLQPATKQLNNSLFFDVESTSIPGGIHHVTMGPNPLNVFLDGKCDCGGTNSYKCCVHFLAAFLQYTSNLESRLEKGYVLLHSGQVVGRDYDEGVDLWKDLLNRYERCLDLLKAIEQGFDVSQLTKPFKDRLATTINDILLSA